MPLVLKVAICMFVMKCRNPKLSANFHCNFSFLKSVGNIARSSMDKFVIRKRKHEENEEKKEKSPKKLALADADTGDSLVNEMKGVSKTELKLDPDLSSSDKSTYSKCQNTLDTMKTETSVKVERELKWREIRGENLNCDYCVLLGRTEADKLLKDLENTLEYNEGMLAKVKIFGKWHDIPRKQVAYGDEGLAYRFSNNTVPAKPWIPLLDKVKNQITQVTGYDFNFVLINRYHDGNDHMGEHRDDEKDLVHGYPIASLSLGQARDFIFKHADARGKNAKRNIPPVKLELQHGSLLMMKHPTNTYWYHALPPRKRLPNVRINMTFRKMVV